MSAKKRADPAKSPPAESPPTTRCEETEANGTPETLAAFDADEAHRFVNVVYRDVPGWFGLSWIVGVQWRNEAFPNAEGALARAARLDPVASSIYLRTTTTRTSPEARGRAEDSAYLPGLWADLDFGTAGHKHDPAKHNGLVLPPSADAALSVVAASGLPAPTLLVHSGGGLYPWWLLDEPADLTDTLAEWARRSAAWQQQLTAGAETLGYHYGPVGDLARVLRLPGSVNRKTADERACRVVSTDGPRYSSSALEDALEASRMVLESSPGPAPRRSSLSAEDRAELDFLAATEPGPFDVLAQEVGIARVLLAAGWTECECDRRDVDEHFTRPGGGSTTDHSAHTLTENPHVLVVWSTESGLPVGGGQALTAGRVFAALHWGGDMSAAARDILAAQRGKGSPAAQALGLPAEEKESTRVDVTNANEAAEWLRQEVGRHGTPLAGLFRRDGKLVYTPRIGEDGYVPLEDDDKSEDGPAQVRPIDGDILRAWVTFGGYEVGKYVGKDWTWTPANFPADAAKLVVSAGELELAPALRPLLGVTHTPMLRADGSVLSAEGYDPASARLYLPEPGMTVAPVPDAPTKAEVQAAHDLISLMIVDFPFNTDHDRANYLALLFTPLLRVMVPPPYPLGLIHAHQPASGKGYLAEILRTLHGGALRPLPGSNDEFRKQITSILSVTTAPVVQFDNVHKLKSSALDALLTADTWADRVLGYTANFSGKNDRLWIATGNNVAIGGDLLRRIRWINIDPDVPHPEQRTGFAIPDLPVWVRENRGELLVALLTLLRAWVREGKPLGPEVGSDSFANWTRAMQGVLSVAGWPGTVGHVETVQQDSNDEDVEWGVFLAAVWRLFEAEAWTVKELLDRVSEFDGGLSTDDLPADMSDRNTRSAGAWLRNRKGRWAGGYALRPAGLKNNTATWRVQKE